MWGEIIKMKGCPWMDEEIQDEAQERRKKQNKNTAQMKLPHILTLLSILMKF